MKPKLAFGHVEYIAGHGDDKSGAGAQIYIADGILKPIGLPNSAGLSESEYCVFDMQTGSAPPSPFISAISRLAF